MNIQTIITTCDICGAVVYIEVIVDGEAGIPSGMPEKHREWHERNGS